MWFLYLSFVDLLSFLVLLACIWNFDMDGMGWDGIKHMIRHGWKLECYG
jgi:hypothetical protein